MITQTYELKQMQTTFRSPSFPPADALISAAQSIDWRTTADRAIAVALLVAATIQALSVRAWHHRGRIAPMLRKLASLLIALADRMPEPLSAASPRPALIAALAAHGTDRAVVAKLNTAALTKRCQKAGLF